MDKFKRAMHDASCVYSTPHEVVVDDSLTREQKIKILRQWEYDARDIQVAEEENMTGPGPNMLSQVLKALLELGVETNPDNLNTTKQGGGD